MIKSFWSLVTFQPVAASGPQTTGSRLAQPADTLSAAAQSVCVSGVNRVWWKTSSMLCLSAAGTAGSAYTNALPACLPVLMRLLCSAPCT